VTTFSAVLRFLGVVCLASVAQAALPGQKLLLKESWNLQTSAEVKAQGEAISTVGFRPEGWHRTSVPATLLAALVADGTYPDPYYSDNIRRIPGYRDKLWLVMKKDSPFYPSWWYRTEFDLPADWAGKNLVLHLDGINLRANVWLNGKRIADDKTVLGMFRRFEFDINDSVRFGAKNCMALEITGPGHIEQPNYRTKQIEATTGWDDHNPQPPDLNTGIWRDVYITATGPVALRHPYVSTKLDLPSLDTAHLTVSAVAINKTSKAVTGTLVATIESARVSQQVTLGPKESKTIIFTPADFPQLNLPNPRVWWPVDVGPQELYELDLRFSVGDAASDVLETRFGIREATTYINKEGWRGYKINGRNILIRGGAWMTCDMLLRLTQRRYDALVRYAREGHLNMLRSEGFSIRETDEFYDLCDQYGVMVTQQIFGRSIPDEPLAIACIEDTLLRIRNHPSLVHFLGHDETFPTKALDKAYRDLIARYTPERTYQPHSGAFELAERFKTGGTRTGSLQVWTYAPPNHYYISKTTGAWGFAQSGGIGGIFACAESMRRFLPENEIWPPWTKAWSLHTVTQGGQYFDAVLRAMNDRYGRPADIDEFCRKGFALNYECARGMFEAYGRNKYSATGITTWKYDAAWPASPTWQYVDWYLVATGAYYGAKKACEPLHVQYSYDDQSICVMNGTYQDKLGLRVSARLLDFDLAEKFSRSSAVDLPADGVVKVFNIERPKDLSKTYFLILKLEDREGKVLSDNFYWLSTIPDVPNLDMFFEKPRSTADYKDLNRLPPAKLEIVSKTDRSGVAQVTLKNPSTHLSFFNRVSLRKGEGGPEVAPVYWSDNCISLLPGQEKTLTAVFSADDLDGKPPVIRVDGWNSAP
jgi:exo-1,4-beta-D-glucosaminidase